MPRRARATRTTVRAASTDSFITSPSEPVRDDVALAGHHRGLDGQQFAADLGPGQADRPGRPGSSSRLRPKSNLRTPRNSFEVLRRDRRPCFAYFFELQRLDRPCGRSCEISRSSDAHARLARVVADDVAQRVVGDRPLARPSAPLFFICLGSR
jgi:hypothetical protein